MNLRDDPKVVAFKFKTRCSILKGKLIGKEFDLAIEEDSKRRDQIKFIVTNTNYYSGSKVRFAYSGTVQGDTIELSRERILEAKEESGKRDSGKQTFKIKRL